jgi:hypothetical protein
MTSPIVAAGAVTSGEAPMADDDARRAQRVKIKWSKDGAAIGRLYVGGEFWGAVEWSEKRQAWCVEDAEGQCLRHAASIHGQESSKVKAVALAGEMIRDGRMPTPQQAVAVRAARLAKERARRAPERARRAAEREREMQHFSLRCDLEFKDRQAQPLWEALHEVFDFTDPELWRSNSFAVLRPRLVIHFRAVAATLEHDCVHYRKPPRWRRQTEWQRRSLADAEAKLTKVRKVLAAIDAGGAP